MNGHLVAVKVGVECRTDKRMKLNRLAFHEDRLKCLNSETVKCRCAVQHDRMLGNDILKYIPHAVFKPFHHLLRALDIVRGASLDELLHHEGLEEFDRHLLRQAALIDLQFGADNDNGTAGVVHSFSEKILAETAVFALQHIGKGLQGPVAGTGHRPAPPSVVNQRIHGFLEHTLFIAHDDLGRTEFQEPLQTVISVYDSSVEVIEIRCGKTPAVQLYHRAEIRRNYRNCVHHHPLRPVSGLAECFNHFKTLDNPCPLLARGFFQLSAEIGGLLFQVNTLQQLLNRFSAHTDPEIPAVSLSRVLIFPLI